MVPALTGARIPADFVGHWFGFPDQPSYRAVIGYIVDGDTYDALVDLGFNDYRWITIRLRGVDTPEMNAADPIERGRAQRAKSFAVRTLMGHAVQLVTYKDTQTFGRYVADVHVLREDGLPMSFAALLTEADLLKRGPP